MKLGEIASALGLEVHGDGSVEIERMAQLGTAGPGDIVFVRDEAAAAGMGASRASAFILPPTVRPDRPAIVSANPLAAMAGTLELLSPEPAPPPGVHPTAVIEDSAEMGRDVHAGPHVSVGAGARIGAGACLRAGARIGAGAVVGPGSVIFENVVVYDHCQIGARCRIHANSTIGADGFGYARLADGGSVKIPQRGIVRIEDDVEVGANSSIDRATLGETVIKNGVKIDNQVQVGHNCVIGENVVIAGCSGVAGSVVIGENVMIGGMAAISDHVHIAPGTLIAGKTGVHGDIKEPGVYAGPMAMKNMEYKRFLLSGKAVASLKKKVKQLEDELKTLKGKEK
ncbi:MAG: UDP-3-O-(3-hydroxymyristoyl)glucosamine N-acyltransferase [Candidatus Nitrospinota bacterium M3_3B_026]